MRPPDFPDRAWLPDQLKGWAVIWMILVHSVELFLDPDQRDGPIAQFALFMGGVPAAPVFMVLMGYYSLPAGSAFIKTFVRGGKLLIWGLLLNVGLNLSLIIKWLTGQAEVNIYQFLFGIDILIFAGMAVMIVSIINLLKIRWYGWFFLSMAVALISQWLNSGPPLKDMTGAIHWSAYISAIFVNSAPWSYFPLIPWLSYVFFGIGLFRLIALRPRILERTRYSFYLALPGIILFLLGLASGWKISQNLEQYYHHGLAFFIWALAFIFLLSLTVKATYIWKNQSLFQWIRFLGVKVTSVYIIQWLIIGNLGTWLYQTLNIFETLLLFSVILLSTFSISFTYYKIRIS